MAHWLNSIAVYAPDARVVIVGTHKDELKDVVTDLGTAQQKLTDFISGLFLPAKARSVERIQQTSDGKWFFAVDSKSREITVERGKEVVQCVDPVVQEIRSTLEQAVLNDDRKVRGLYMHGSKSQCFKISACHQNICVTFVPRILCSCSTPDLNGNETKYIDFEMPTRALMLLDELITLYSERSVCSFKEVQNAATELGLPDNNGFIRCLLEIFSALGAVSWFPKVDHNLVVLKPQWLLDSLACLIREHEGHHSQLLKDLKQDKHAIPLFKEATVRSGFFPAELLKYIWSSDKQIYKALRAQPAAVEAVTRILESFNLICRVRLLRGKRSMRGEYFVVPALLANPAPGSRPNDRIQNLLDHESNAQQYKCLLNFAQSKWLPNYIFERLLCAIVASSNAHNIVMARGVASFCVGDAVLLLHLNADSWCIEATTVKYDACPHAAPWMLTVLQKGMETVLPKVGKQEAYELLLVITDNDYVDLSELRDIVENGGQSMIDTTTDKPLKIAPLANEWLRVSVRCKTRVLRNIDKASDAIYLVTFTFTSTIPQTLVLRMIRNFPPI